MLYQKIYFFPKTMNGEDNLFSLGSLYDILHIFKAKKCLESLLKGAKVLMISLVHSPL